MTTPDDSATGWLERIDEAAALVRSLAPGPPDIAVVLGSGLGAFADALEAPTGLAFSDIPHFPASSVVGHAGRLVAGTLRGARVVVLQGRVHGYEGYSAAEVAFPTRVVCRLGVRALVLTNAAGCLNPAWAPGELMRLTDHLNLSGRNPLVGPNEPALGPRFPDLSRTYDPRLARALEEAAAALGLPLRAGVYACLLGPSYETPAEIRMVRALGGDAVGMSTVPEAIAAAHMGVPVVGISCLTNMAAGLLDQPLSHAEVTETADRVREAFIALLAELMPRALAALRP